MNMNELDFLENQVVKFKNAGKKLTKNPNYILNDNGTDIFYIGLEFRDRFGKYPTSEHWKSIDVSIEPNLLHENLLHYLELENNVIWRCMKSKLELIKDLQKIKE